MLARGVGEGFRHFGLVCRQTGPTDLIRLGRRKPRGREVRLIWIKSAAREWRGGVFSAFRPPPKKEPPGNPPPPPSSEGNLPPPRPAGVVFLLVFLALAFSSP